MKSTLKYFSIIVLISFSGSVFAQLTTLDWKMHTVGKVRVVVTNIGGLSAKGDTRFDYKGLINCEFPPGSREEHLTEAGIWIGAVVGGDTLVSVTYGESSPQEFYPTSAAWDTIWVVNRGDTVDIPYWPKYVGVSDQDFVCRYTDYGPASLRISSHRPLFLDVIQTSYAWSANPLDQFVVLQYYIIPTRIDLKQVYLTSWMNGNVGYGLTDAHGLDDESFFIEEKMLSVTVDIPGGEDGTAFSPVALKVLPPPSPDPLRLTYIWYNGRMEGLPGRDQDRYKQMTAGTIMQPQSSTMDGTKSMVTAGPYSVSVGDTLHLVVGLILGEGLNGVLRNADYLDWLIGQNFRVPSPPPAPPLRIETRNKQVILRWKALPGDADPEQYRDPYRADSTAQPFEGYRVYKSTVSLTGPWTLLAEYDVADNEYFQNTGLSYEYVDVGLLNNLEYYYSVTAFSKPDAVIKFPSQESSINANAKRAVPGTEPPSTVGAVAVVPNPYRGDIAYHSYNPPWEKAAGSRDRWMEQDRRVQFINLPAQCEIKIYTLAGDFVYSIEHDNPVQGYEDWNLTSYVGQAISSGIYLFSVKDKKSGDIQVGKFILIK